MRFGRLYNYLWWLKNGSWLLYNNLSWLLYYYLTCTKRSNWNLLGLCYNLLGSLDLVFNFIVFYSLYLFILSYVFYCLSGNVLNFCHWYIFNFTNWNLFWNCMVNWSGYIFFLIFYCLVFSPYFFFRNLFYDFSFMRNISKMLHRNLINIYFFNLFIFNCSFFNWIVLNSGFPFNGLFRWVNVWNLWTSKAYRP